MVFVEVMKSGGIMSLFLLAGEKMLKATTEWKELEQAYEAHEKNPCPNNTLKVEELEDKFEGTHEYETFGNETLQAAKLQSMDYCNKVTDKLYVYDLCRAKKGDGKACGTYMPALYWKKVGNWRFYCLVDWAQVVAIFPGAFEEMKTKYDSDVSNWPTCGCSARFRPWGRGESKVVEMWSQRLGCWITFIADRIPEILDDKVKAHQAAIVAVPIGNFLGTL